MKFASFIFLLLAAALDAATYASNGSASNINTLIASATTGDTITIPAGSFAWGSTQVDVNKNVSLVGAGKTSTFITSTIGQGLAISGGGAATDFSITGPAGSGSGVIVAQTTSGWRVGRMAIVSGASSNQTFNADCPGVLFDSDIDNGGTAEGIWTTALGGTAAHTTQEAVWATDPDYGSVNAIYVERCTFSNGGYVSDLGYASRAVIRFCTITDKSQIDAHGPESNWRSNRQVEAYDNTWTFSGTDYYNAFNIRGGALIAFDNVVTGNAGGSTWFLIHHYGPETNGFGDPADSPLLLHQFWTPYQYPLPEQVGVGKTPGSVAAADPAYVFHNTNVGSEWGITYTQGFLDVNGTTNSAGYSTGATAITLTAVSGINSTFYAGNVVKFTGDSHYYTVATDRVGPGVLTLTTGLLTAIPAAPTAVIANSTVLYQNQTSSPSATFTMQDVIATDRDLFLSVTPFTGTSGVGRGTRAQMNAITPTLAKAGFWVTDEGSWNTTLPANTSGRLYQWSGSAWVIYYTPYTYPHPLTQDSNPVPGNPKSASILLSIQ